MSRVLNDRPEHSNLDTNGVGTLDHHASLKLLREQAMIDSNQKHDATRFPAHDASSPMAIDLRIEQAVTRAHAVFVLAEQIDTPGNRSKDQTGPRCRADRAMDELVGFLLENFACSGRREEIDALVLTVFEQTAVLDTMNATTLASMHETIIPFAMTREFCYRYPRVFNPARWHNLPALMARYENSIAKANETLCERNLTRLVALQAAATLA